MLNMFLNILVDFKYRLLTTKHKSTIEYEKTEREWINEWIKQERER